jgi:hypothetical protein
MNLLVDINNIAFATRYAKLGTPKSKRQKERKATESLFKEILQTILNHAFYERCSSIIIAQDSKDVWRRDIYPMYKKSSTTDEDIYYSETLAAADMLSEFIKECTSGMVLSVNRCEADDIIGVWCQESDSHNTILSTDRDYEQLVDSKTRLYSPVQKVYREPEDAQFSLFVKCIRGDKHDTISSAYPRVRLEKLKEAWEDDYAFLNLLETVNKSGEKVGTLFERNQKLIDLSMQPQHLRDLITNKISNYECGKYSEMKAKKFLHDRGLEMASDMLNFKDKCLKNKPIFKNM